MTIFRVVYLVEANGPGEAVLFTAFDDDGNDNKHIVAFEKVEKVKE